MTFFGLCFIVYFLKLSAGYGFFIYLLYDFFVLLQNQEDLRELKQEISQLRSMSNCSGTFTMKIL